MIRRVLRDISAYGGFVLAFIALFVVGTAIVPAMFADKPERFCNMGLAFTIVDGVDVALEDQGEPGRDDCDMDPDRWMSVQGGSPLMNVLFFDCKVRDGQMKIVATTTPNRPDGTCGQEVPPRSGGRGSSR